MERIVLERKSGQICIIAPIGSVSLVWMKCTSGITGRYIEIFSSIFAYACTDIRDATPMCILFKFSKMGLERKNWR